MRVSVAGISLDIPRVTFVFDLWRATPVFHRWGEPDHSGCGLDLDSATPIPPRLAVKIGRPWSSGLRRRCSPVARGLAATRSRRR